MAYCYAHAGSHPYAHAAADRYAPAHADADTVDYPLAPVSIPNPIARRLG